MPHKTPASSKRKRSSIAQTLFFNFVAFLIFAAIIGFVVTCSFLLFFHSIELSEAEVRQIAPIVFVNVLILAALFLLVDTIRRRIIVNRPVKRIQAVLKTLQSGDFTARLPDSFQNGYYNQFAEIAQSINLLASELSGVETLRTDFVANVSHEIKTPLAVMQNYGTLLQQPDLSEEKRIEYAKAITDAARRLTHLVTNMLKLNKLENQQIFPSVAEYNLGEQLCECLLQFEDVWEKKSINIETDVEEDVLIRSDADLLSHVWNNLFSNAFKFTEAGGTVSLTLKSDEDHVTVTVADTGCGMSPEVGAHIFEKFYQGDSSHSSQGNGLGLALVKRVVDIMQGEIGIESVRGEGSVFTVKLPK